MATVHAQQAAHEARPHPTDELLSVRLATRRDWGKLCRMECACFGMARLLFGLWPCAGKRNTQVWIAEDNGHPTGYLIAYPKALDGSMVTYVGGVGVLPDYRRAGIGTRLMRAVLAEGRPVWLHVRAGNTPAISMYRKLGMVQLRRVPRFYSNGETAVVMATPSTHEH